MNYSVEVKGKELQQLGSMGNNLQHKLSLAFQ